MAARRTNYITPARLAELVSAHRATGVACPELCECLMQIAGGVWDRYRYTSSREDFVQETTLHLLQRPLAKADVQKHIFNYFTTCAIRHGWKLRNKEQGDARRFETYAAELQESGRELPDERAERERDRADDERPDVFSVDVWDGDLSPFIDPATYPARSEPN